jgi:hypothetical protein
LEKQKAARFTGRPFFGFRDSRMRPAPMATPQKPGGVASCFYSTFWELFSRAGFDVKHVRIHRLNTLGNLLKPLEHIDWERSGVRIHTAFDSDRVALNGGAQRYPDTLMFKILVLQGDRALVTPASLRPVLANSFQNEVLRCAHNSPFQDRVPETGLFQQSAGVGAYPA